ncbi:hypothetical protein G6F50_015386 [Rhizopus delemar]|uniref:Uncharacterized protein n=1 Tax=Rhizopus delemar TaxID=936053 RepID=A0A9P7C4S1_9FUNG|nr:hypothetical protein G6F50_015386 [Rhizopus delemar]
MRIERHHQRILDPGVHVVEQDAHAHAAFGRVIQRLGHQVADQVVVPDVVLQVQAASCVRGDHRAGRERIHAIAEERDAGLAGMGLLQWHDLLVDARLRRLQWQHVRGRALCLRREMVGQQQAGQHQQQQGGDDDRSDTQQASTPCVDESQKTRCSGSTTCVDGFFRQCHAMRGWGQNRSSLPR